MLNGLRHWTDRQMVALGERSARRLWPSFPHTIRLDHPATAEARPRYGHGRPSHPKLEKMLEEQIPRYRAELEGFAAFFEDLAGIPVRGTDSLQPCWLNEWLIGLDTVSLYGFARRRKPANYVEVGSGQSTKVVARARQDGDLGTRITSVDPSPRSEINKLCDRIIRQPLEQVDLTGVFGDLEAGDVVFFDGSHRVLPNSDCAVFFLDVLPSLPDGVLVGIHDVYLPDDYPQLFFDMSWSEQYMLAALLLAESPYLQVALPSFYVSGLLDLSARLEPLFDLPHLAGVNPGGSSFWLEIAR